MSNVLRFWTSCGLTCRPRGLGELAQLGERGVELEVGYVGQLDGRDHGVNGGVSGFCLHAARGVSEWVKVEVPVTGPANRESAAK